MKLDGKPIGGTGDLEHEPGANTGGAGPINAYFTETYVAEDHLLGWVDLAAGRHLVTFTCVGKHGDSSNYFLGIDTLILARLGPVVETPAGRRARELREVGERLAGRGRAPGAPGVPAGQTQALTDALRDPDADIREAAAWALGQVHGPAAALVRALVAALSDDDVVVRGLAAVALRDAEVTADVSGLLPALVARLKDPDTGVRMVSAQAIASLGRRSAPALEALIAACRNKDEHVHVQRSLADALGAIGPQAQAALPELRELARIPRVRWSAEAAIRRITESGKLRTEK